MERVVVGVGDAAGHRAVEWVIRRARRTPVDIRLVRAFEMAMSDPIDNRRILDAAKDRILDALPDAAVTASLIMKTAVDAIVDAAAEADLVVVGGRHERGMASALGTAVPLRVASRSHTVTVVVPPGWQPGDAHGIVVGVDDDDTSDAALRFAAREAVTSKASLLLVHAWSMPPMAVAEVPVVAQDAEIQAAHRADLTEALTRVRAAQPGVVVDGVLEERPPATALAEHGDRADMIVIGSHRWGPLAGLVLGSTARDLLARTASPLCIVPPTP